MGPDDQQFTLGVVAIYYILSQSHSNMSEKIEQPQQETIQQPKTSTDQQALNQSIPKQAQQPIEIKPEQPQEQKFVQDNKQLAEKYKAEGAQHFKSQSYSKAISSYQQALRYAAQSEPKLRAILYSNIGICLTKEDDHKDAIEYCKKSIKSEPTYMKAHLNLAVAYEKVDNPEEALQAYKKIVELTPADIKSQLKVKELEKVVEELNEKRKKEVMDGLKTIGNSFLGLFGLSINNFKLNQTDGGGYNVSFQN